MTSRRARLSLVVAVAALSLIATSFAIAGGKHDKKGGDFRANLMGLNEVLPVNTPGHAELSLNVSSDKLTFKLTYADLTGPPGAAHIHIGQPGVNGGVSVFFCGGGGKPACPVSNSGTVEGTIVAADVVGPTTQGFNAGDLASVITAIKAGVTYANMHTAKWPNGEIRGQIFRGHGHHGDHH